MTDEETRAVDLLTIKVRELTDFYDFVVREFDVRDADMKTTEAVMGEIRAKARLVG